MNRFIAACIACAFVAGRALAAAGECDVPPYLLAGDSELKAVAAAVAKQNHLYVVVIGTGSSQLPGSGGPAMSYPARLEAALRERLPQADVKVKTYVRPRQPAAEMAKGFGAILAAEKPDLVIWQTGTADAIRGIEPEEFRNVLNEGVEALQSAGADVILMNMQYSPRMDTIMALSAYIDNMRWVAQERGVPLFDRLAIMQYWNEAGIFDLNAATKSEGMAQQVHACIARALATLVIEAAHLDVAEEKVPH